MAKTNWGLNDVVQPSDLNGIGQEINQLREDVDNIEIPQASLTQAGIVQLSNAANAVDEDKAATPKAVKTAYDAAATAQNNVDNHAALTTAHGATSAATANRIIVRDSAGRAKIAAPSASDDIARKDTVDNVVGNLSNLLTSAKGNTVAAINELFTSASNGKSQIAAAITGKGVPASGSDTFAQLAAKIGQIVLGRRIESGSGTGSNLEMTLTRYVNPTTASIYSGYYSLTVSGLAFTPSLVIIRSQNISQTTFYITLYMNGANFATLPGADIASLYLNINASSITPSAANLLKVDHDAYVINGGFRLPCSLGGNHAVYWTAIE